MSKVSDLAPGQCQSNRPQSNEFKRRLAEMGDKRRAMLKDYSEWLFYKLVEPVESSEARGANEKGEPPFKRYPTRKRKAVNYKEYED